MDDDGNEDGNEDGKVDEDDNKAQDFEALKEELMNEKLELEWKLSSSNV